MTKLILIPPVRFVRPTDPFLLPRGDHFHYGTDFGPQTSGVAGDPLVAAAPGAIVYTGVSPSFGNVTIVGIGRQSDGSFYYLLYGHQRPIPDAYKVSSPGDSIGVSAGEGIGTMGNTGSSAEGSAIKVHGHFEVWKTDKELDFSKGWPLLANGHSGLANDGANWEKVGATFRLPDGRLLISDNGQISYQDPFKTGDQPIDHLEATKTAQQNLSNTNSFNRAGLSPVEINRFYTETGNPNTDPSGSLGNGVSRAAAVPYLDLTKAAQNLFAKVPPSDFPASPSWASRFGNQGPSPTGGPGGAPSPVMPEPQKRSAAPDGSVWTSAQGAAPTTPALQQDGLIHEPATSTENFPGASAIAAAPSPLAFNDSGSGPGARTDVYALAQRIRQLMSDAGQYMWDGLPSPAQAVLLSRSRLPGQAALDLAGEETRQDPGNVPERRLARIIVDPSAGGPGDTRSSPAPQPQESEGPLSLEEAYRLYLFRLNANKPQASMSDPTVPTTPFDASDRNPPGFSAADWIASLAGVDPQNPTQPASSPQARGLAGSPYSGNPIQSWGDTPEYAGRSAEQHRSGGPRSSKLEPACAAADG